MLASILSAYCRHSPISTGKWRVINYAEKILEHGIEKSKTWDGIHMELDTSDFIQRTIFLTGLWDSNVRSVIVDLLQDGDVFVDAGANVGYFTLLAAKLVGSSGRVFSFEPNPATLELMRRNIEINSYDNIKVYEAGLSDRDNTGVLFLDNEGNSGAASQRQNYGVKVPINLVTLDSILEENSVGQVRLVKIDVEGSEIQVLRGAERLLSSLNAPNVLCEVSELSLIKMGGGKDELFSLMRGHGYQAKIISPIRRSNLSSESVYFQYDVLFSKS